MDQLKPFEIIHKGETLQVNPKRIGPDTVYMVHFPSRRPPLMLAVASRHLGGHFWTTIPEAKDKAQQTAALAEAAELGTLISAHYKELNKS